MLLAIAEVGTELLGYAWIGVSVMCASHVVIKHTLPVCSNGTNITIQQSDILRKNRG